MSTITLTFGEVAENHRGMQKIGNGVVDSGFNLNEMEMAKLKFEEKGYKCDYVRLDQDCKIEEHKLEEASVLVIRDGVKALIDTDADEVFKEQIGLVWDSKAYMYGRVVEKRARHNLCYGDQDQKADYENKKGTIVSWDRIPYTKKLRDNLEQFFGSKAHLLQGEGNLYYDIKKCGIGFHGDTERRIVIAVRLGASLPLHYQWFYKGKSIGNRIELNINHGDVYVMSDKATGQDWKKRNIPTLRHAAGCKKFTTIKQK